MTTKDMGDPAAPAGLSGSAPSRQEASRPPASIPIACPSCHTELSAEVSAQLMRESRVTWKIAPKPGEMMNAGAVGGTLVDVEKLFKAVAKQQTVGVEVLVESIATDTEGAISFNLLLCRMKPGWKEAPASGIETRRAETAGLGAKPESPVAEGETP